MIFGIIGALDAEIEQIKSVMTLEETVEIMGITYYKGNIDNVKLVLVCASIGKVNATCCAITLAREFKVDVLINTGIAGAMGKNLKTLDVVVSTSARYHDHSDFYKKYHPFTNEFMADKTLVDATLKACEIVGKANNFNYYTGLIITGDLFVSTKEDKDRLVKKHSPMCTEMEGAAIAQVAHTCNIPFVIIRSMSDNADDDAHETYDNLIELSAKNASSIVLNLLKIYK